MISHLTSIRELAFIVGDAFIKAERTAVLSGGGAAEVYAPSVYQSQDLDFILSFGGGAAHVIEQLGFSYKSGMYRHPDTIFTLEFPPGPLAIGEDYGIKPVRLTDEQSGQQLDIISPTDCVRDRLAWYLFGNRADFSALSQAVAIAKNLGGQIDYDKIRSWGKDERVEERLAHFLVRVGQAI
ncbi:MAG: hypothetical protein QE269_05625 [Fimbriimonas sp.]|nr:hypothetical protein [Fimbriimonas sp.]